MSAIKYPPMPSFLANASPHLREDFNAYARETVLLNLQQFRSEVVLAVDLLDSVTAVGGSDANYLGKAENALSRLLALIDGEENEMTGERDDRRTKW